MKTILVNNPAAKEGGVLTILKEFLDKISSLKCNRKFVIITCLEELKKYEKNNIMITVIKKQSFKNRLLWDNFYLKKYIENNNLKIDLFISLQNTGANIPKDIPQFMYYQQALSLGKNKWNIFNKKERLYWMYENLYPIFIRQYLKHIKKVFVQTDWIKENFALNFNYKKENIILMRPEIKKINMENIISIPKITKFRIFYPATPYIYKNHEMIIKALGTLKKEKIEIINEIECVFTFSKFENQELYEMIHEYKLEKVIKLVGKISYDEVLGYYKNSDIMIFPSYLETFGLPLIEAQQFNLPIIALNLPYTREACKTYEKIYLLKKDDEESLKKIMLEIIKGVSKDESKYNNCML